MTGVQILLPISLFKNLNPHTHHIHSPLKSLRAACHFPWAGGFPAESGNSTFSCIFSTVCCDTQLGNCRTPGYWMPKYCLLSCLPGNTHHPYCHLSLQVSHGWSQIITEISQHLTLKSHKINIQPASF